MAIVRFATVCDKCGARSIEYSHYPICRDCGDDVCSACDVPSARVTQDDWRSQDRTTCCDCFQSRRVRTLLHILLVWMAAGAIILLGATTAHCQERTPAHPTIGKAAVWTFAIGETADIVTTAIALQHPTLREGNPLYKPAPILLKSAATAGLAYALYRAGRKQPRLVRYALYAFGLTAGTAAIFNVRTLRHEQRR